MTRLRTARPESCNRRGTKRCQPEGLSPEALSINIETHVGPLGKARKILFDENRLDNEVLADEFDGDVADSR